MCVTAENDRAAAKPPSPAESDASALSPQLNVDLLDHEYDGIREYDNPLPRWWTWMFAGSFVFSVLYLAHYQFGTGAGVHDDYRAEVKAFEVAEERRLLAMGEVSEENLAQLVENATSVEKGRVVFGTHCQQCHGEAGEGNIGPNLTDEYWIHGDGSFMSVYHAVRDGSVTKGMPAWGRTLNPLDLRLVSAYVGSLRGAKLPGKSPEGRRVEVAKDSDTTLSRHAD
jgi:cytochrome c oxidase cbb3-type subunit III